MKFVLVRIRSIVLKSQLFDWEGGVVTVDISRLYFSYLRLQIIYMNKINQKSKSQWIYKSVYVQIRRDVLPATIFSKAKR